MHGQLSRISKTQLSQTPLLTPVIIGLDNPAEAGLAVRADDLFSFRRQGLPLLVRSITYQGKEGVWIVAIIFHLSDAHGHALEGALYLNPRNAWDLHLLQCLIKQDKFPILFLSSRLHVAITHHAGWTVHQRQGLRQMLAQATPFESNNASINGEDADFEKGKQEFERTYSIKKLLTLQTMGTIRSSTSFRGAILD